MSKNDKKRDQDVQAKAKQLLAEKVKAQQEHQIVKK